MSIPKKIWALWCNFKDKTDGVLNPRLTYFKNRIVQQHPGWEINIITSWDQLIEFISENETLLDLLDNPIVGGAHKSDAIRFYLLNKFGGFWLDISTFLFTSLDIYYEIQPKATFIGYYTPPFMVEEIIFSSFGDMFDNVTFNEIVKKFKPIQGEFIDLNEEYKNYPFIPENFFIASIPNHPVISDVFQQLIDFWDQALTNISDEKTLCYEINKLMNELSGEIFEINNSDYTLSNTFTNNDFITEDFKKKILDNVWHCGYVFNYLQMYKAIVHYIQDTQSTISQEENVSYTNEFSNDLCSKDENIDACKNIVCTDPADGTVLYLVSLSYNRLIKWANTMEERITFDNTYIKERIDNIGKNGATSDQLIKDIVDMGIYQIKFSSWTRDTTLIEKLMRHYPVNNSTTNTGGSRRRKTRKTRKTRNKKTRNKKTRSKKTRNKKTT